MSLSFKYLLEKTMLPVVEGHVEQSQWVNEDLLPTPPEKQSQFDISINFTNWTLGSSMIGIGLSWWQSIVVIFVSQLICSIAMAFNSRAESVYHIGYPCVVYSIFGIWGNYHFVVARAVMAVICAEYMYNILRAIFGHHFTDISNRLPTSAGITSLLILAFFLCWLVQLPFCHFRPYQLRKFFWFKSIVSLLSMFGLIRSLSTSTSRSSSATAWLILAGINSGIGNLANLIINQPDYSRWSNTPNASVWTQLVVTPISVTLSASFGIIATTADSMNLILDHYWSSRARFAVFLYTFAWLAQIYIIEFLDRAVFPLEILVSATKFQAFLSGYALMVAVAIMLCDHFLLTKGTVALAAYIFGIVVPFPGFYGVLGASVYTAASHIMDIAWVTSFVTSFIVYFAICWIWPTQNMKFVRERVCH
ncbi:permease for cytosine/purines, uracil, thiamine, allantoin-domain-containing protein [Aspergillus bertholletiae]|uniref:Permease for cytosine/purines, uracil, thiamine, allantoin-domain-containing protein n=1 Tax=Aspergillus bertholletiae TaxID=1226010 RepID=A0A5N7BKT1_9EURO|nr:permease for cytosine/purines, uracil, thiamine, allantoin-domain-containing protein [Aspergillus bertholletiae]